MIYKPTVKVEDMEVTTKHWGRNVYQLSAFLHNTDQKKLPQWQHDKLPTQSGFWLISHKTFSFLRTHLGKRYSHCSLALSILNLLRFRVRHSEWRHTGATCATSTLAWCNFALEVEPLTTLFKTGWSMVFSTWTLQMLSQTRIPNFSRGSLFCKSKKLVWC